MAQPHLGSTQNILEMNDRLAPMLRTSFAQHGVLAVNFVSGPGAAKPNCCDARLSSWARTGAALRLQATSLPPTTPPAWRKAAHQPESRS